MTKTHVTVTDSEYLDVVAARDLARDFAQRVEAENAQLIEQLAAVTARAGTVEQELAAAEAENTELKAKLATVADHVDVMRGSPLETVRMYGTDIFADLHAATIWCHCFDTPEPDGHWIYPDDVHADTCGFTSGQS